MARKTKTITIPGVRSEEAGQRDNGKCFLITEMPARQAEQWADRAFLALAHANVNLPSESERSGMAGIVGIVYLFASVQFPELAPLMDELMGCVVYVSDHVNRDTRQPITRPLIDNGAEGDDIEEVATRQMLRREVMDLHVNFLLGARMLDLIARASELRDLPDTETTPTSPSPSESSSEAA